MARVTLFLHYSKFILRRPCLIRTLCIHDNKNASWAFKCYLLIIQLELGPWNIQGVQSACMRAIPTTATRKRIYLKSLLYKSCKPRRPRGRRKILISLRSPAGQHLLIEVSKLVLIVIFWARKSWAHLYIARPTRHQNKFTRSPCSPPWDDQNTAESMVLHNLVKGVGSQGRILARQCGKKEEGISKASSTVLYLS